MWLAKLKRRLRREYVSRKGEIKSLAKEKLITFTFVYNLSISSSTFVFLFGYCKENISLKEREM